MLKIASDNTKIEDTFNMALAALTQHMLKPGHPSDPVTSSETYQLLCARELVRGMVSARLLAESLNNPMQKDEVHELSSQMLDAISHLYPSLGLASNVSDAVEELGKMSSVSAWKIHTRILNMMAPSKKERPFPIPFWPVSQYKAA